MRAFIAVRIVATPRLADVLRELETMRPALRPCAADQLHVTVKFLGDVAESQVPELQSVMNAIANNESPQTLKLQGLGAFPGIERPSVLWVGFDNPQPLIRWANQLEERCQPLGFEPERRPFQPHVTLARVKSKPPRQLIDDFKNNRTTDLGSTTVTSLELYQSESGQDGPVYTPVAVAPLLG